MLYTWHKMSLGNRADLEDIGRYRTHSAPMQIISAYGDIHFEAPPSTQVPTEMASFIDWFNQSATTLPALARSGIAHLYFVSRPFHKLKYSVKH